MKIKFSGLVSQASGKLNGSTVFQTKGGHMMKNRKRPVNPKSNAQSAIRQNLTVFARTWKTLTEVQRQAWQGAAHGINKHNKVGNSYHPSGFNFYVSQNQISNEFGTAVVSVPQATVTSIAPVVATSCTANHTVPALKVFASRDAVLTEIVQIFASPQLSAGVENYNGKLTLLKQVAGVQTFTLGISVLTEYELKYGTLAIGNKVAFKLVWGKGTIVTEKYPAGGIVSSIVV